MQIYYSFAFVKMRKSNVKWILIYIFVFVMYVLISMLISMLDFLYLPEIAMIQKLTNSHKKMSIKKDWHDYKTMYTDGFRFGLGEQGIASSLNGTDRELEEKISLENGFNAMLSDAISVNRSVPDIRNKDCRGKQYLAKLPQASVIMPFQNEHLSVLLRSLHSVTNRSPPELLKEIILVDDFSDRKNLFEPLENYIAEHFTKVKILRLPERSGLIRARMAGMRNATGEVLIVFDSHIETTHNWLPPLLEPIAQNKRSVVCPMIDIIDDTNFEFSAQHDGSRGGFNWEFDFVLTDILPEDLLDSTKPYKNPIMTGGLFAISAEFFWELGGYDEGLQIWGGEQYELSLKIWMCGGQLFDVPCSRVGHIFRGPWDEKPNPQSDKDYLTANYKRVAEVWLDDYKNYIYEHADGAYDNVDAGDLTVQKALREKLKCKPFKWFMEEVAFDIFEQYPPVEASEYAYGAIQNVGAPTLCIDTLGGLSNDKVGLFTCANDLKNPHENQMFSLTYRRDLRMRHKNLCLDVQVYTENAPVWLWECHGHGGNQFWYYDRFKKWLIQEKDSDRCLEALPEKQELYVNNCNKSNTYMQWNFGVINITALDGFFENIMEY